MEQHRVSPRPAVSAADENTVRELALAGEGLAVLREDVARPLAEAGRLVVWERCWLLVPLSLVWLARKGKQGRVRDAVEAVRHVWRQAARSESDGSLADKCWV
ncbi:LysR substrate-binding domain-containing protein [Desulfuromonas sp.]|nr:LysR substrate-binding domain-containing protein [Desulfuromonas sp.]